MRSHFQTETIFWLFPHPASKCDIKPCPAKVRRRGATVFRAMKGREVPVFTPSKHGCAIEMCFWLNSEEFTYVYSVYFCVFFTEIKTMESLKSNENP